MFAFHPIQNQPEQYILLICKGSVKQILKGHIFLHRALSQLQCFEHNCKARHESSYSLSDQPCSHAAMFILFFYSSAFLRELLPCVLTNELAFVCHTSEGARTVRDSGPIFSDLWDPFTTVELRLLSVWCRRLLIFPSYFWMSSIIFYVN